ncbi:hypothetical protein [Streptomyces sp. I05A-00742]|uniref:hypothetical protein n=1 Tax=Streptomyces sp. I05A-00742 TaxID=2732853 RepID=UPI00148929E9|nr:hypothetical protein [Streptomyces sp. I05A-00742]
MPDMDEIIGRIRRDMDSQLRKRARRALGDGVDRGGWAAGPGATSPGAGAPPAAGDAAPVPAGEGSSSAGALAR